MVENNSVIYYLELYKIKYTRRDEVYWIDSTNQFFGIGDEDGRLVLIYKNKTLKSYEPTRRNIQHLCNVFVECVLDFIEYSDYHESNITINDWCYTWVSTCPFSTGMLDIIDNLEYMLDESRGDNCFINKKLEIGEVLGIIFSRHPYVEVITLKARNFSLPILNPIMFPDEPQPFDIKLTQDDSQWMM